MAAELGFTASEQTVLATAISEITRNIVQYARRGEVEISVIQNHAGTGLAIAARDEGPGIADIEQAMQDGFTTGNSLGLGLPGAKRLVDEFEITSTIGAGTTVVMRKWLR